MRDGDRAVADFHIADTKILANTDIIFKLVTDQEGFKQCSAEINRNIIGTVHFQLFPQVGCHE